MVVPLKPEEYQQAEVYLWRSAQADVYEKEVRTLTENHTLSRSEWLPIEKCSSLYNDRLFLDEDGVLQIEVPASHYSDVFGVVS